MTEPGVISDAIEAMIVRPVQDPAGDRTPLVHIAWRLADSSSHVAVQVYVDDELLYVEFDPSIGETWLSLDPFGDQRIDLQAVDATDTETAWVSAPPVADRPIDRIDVRLTRDETLPIDTQLAFAVDGEVVATGPMWGPDHVRGGFGSLFGFGAFGIDAVSAVGLGLGPLGVGAIDADSPPVRFRWSPPDLPLGTATVSASFSDRSGHPVATDSSIATNIDRLAAPPRDLRPVSPDTLAWTV